VPDLNSNYFEVPARLIKIMYTTRSTTHVEKVASPVTALQSGFPRDIKRNLSF